MNIMKAMADYKLDAIVQNSIQHQPARIQDGINPHYVGRKGSPDRSTFFVNAATLTNQGGFTGDGLPVITFCGAPYSEPMVLRLAYSNEQAIHHRMPSKTAPPLAASRNFASNVKSDSAALGLVAKNV